MLACCRSSVRSREFLVLLLLVLPFTAKEGAHSTEVRGRVTQGQQGRKEERKEFELQLSFQTEQPELKLAAFLAYSCLLLLSIT